MTGLPGFAAWGLAGLLVCTALLILRRPVAQLIRLILRSSVGLAALALFSQVGQALGVTLGGQSWSMPWCWGCWAYLASACC